MKPSEFMNQLDDERIAQAIADAESRTSGELRVFISEKTIDEPLAAAQGHFDRLGMAKTRERNGVLLFIAPRSQRFAVVGDSGIHERCGQQFWQHIADDMSGLLREGKFNEALLHAIREIGDVLATQFPRHPDDTNELPNSVERE